MTVNCNEEATLKELAPNMHMITTIEEKDQEQLTTDMRYDRKGIIMATRKPYHYTQCGLDNVYLGNGWSIDKSGALFIENIKGLHKAIGLDLVFVGRTLNGKEIRFIRHYLDFSQKTFGEMLGVDYQSVLRWENNKTKLTKTADNFMKAIFYEVLAENQRAVDLINQMSDLDNARRVERPERSSDKLEMSLTGNKWKTAA
ncbi:MAG: hypothetical protein EPN97_06875 [Alphaproteobacteria bacterium]|nr:MAG: hypothetical protein EPN97_06875 [Alphaproteobacteria bacterium]